MDIKKLLLGLDLSVKESNIYLALIQMAGPQPASIIASKSDLNRTTVYKALLKMVKMGIVTKTMNHGITSFIAEAPDKSISNLIEKRKNQISNVTKLFEELLPDIQNLQRHDQLLPKMRYYEGIEGVKKVYEDTIAENKTIYAFENIEAIDVELEKYLRNYYLPMRVKKDIFAYCIAPENPKCKIYRKEDTDTKRETRFMSINDFPIEIEINIYGNKTALYSYKSEEMFGAILESAAIANTMKALFNICWKAAS